MRRNKPEKAKMGNSAKLLIETNTQIETAIVTDILKQNGIVSYAQGGRGIGGFWPSI